MSDRAKLEGRLNRLSELEPATGCKLWRGSINDSGYGNMTWMGRNEKAHRMAWVCHRGPIPTGLNVLHECDVRRCINPDHLFLGTLGDNNRDRARKGRSFRPLGTLHGCSKLTETEVLAIRASSVPPRLLGAEYGVTDTTIRHIRQRHTWRHL